VPACEKTGSCHCLLCALSTFQNHITLPTAQYRSEIDIAFVERCLFGLDAAAVREINTSISISVGRSTGEEHDGRHLESYTTVRIDQSRSCTGRKIWRESVASRCPSLINHPPFSDILMPCRPPKSRRTSAEVVKRPG